MEERMQDQNAPTQDAPKAKISPIVLALLIFIAFISNFLLCLSIWLLSRYDNVKIDEMFYQLMSPFIGTYSGLLINFLIFVVLLAPIITALEFFLYRALMGESRWLRVKFKKYGSYLKTKAPRIFRKLLFPITAAMLAISVFVFAFPLGVFPYLKGAMTDSSFIEENYVDPDDVTLKFPDKKRNLVYIFLESMENTFGDTSAGGNITENFIHELTKLAEENVSFSRKAYIGRYPYTGTTWTAAAMFSQTSGMILKAPLGGDKFGENGKYLPGIVTLGDILEREGYNQSVMFGSDARFAAGDVYFKTHGSYNIIDVYSLRAEGKLPADYWEWWGFEDAKLFDFAKEEILRLASLGEPFNFTAVTGDTHFPNGYECGKCENTYKNQYANVIRCSSKQVYEFVEWLKAQDFYENTTVVLVADHLTMDPNFLSDINKTYNRTPYDCFINSAVEPVGEHIYAFGSFDLFPTTLAALGVEIEGNRLGLGTNLFSSEKTLTESTSHTYLENEFTKNSEFYLEKFFDKKK